LLCVRWCLRFRLSYRDLAEMMLERGIKLHHSTIYRWVQVYSPELDKRCRPHCRQSNNSFRIDETYIKVKGQWKYLYRAVESKGDTMEFGWMKAYGLMHKLRHRGLEIVDWLFRFTAAAYNITRMKTLMA